MALAKWRIGSGKSGGVSNGINGSIAGDENGVSAGSSDRRRNRKRAGIESVESAAWQRYRMAAAAYKLAYRLRQPMAVWHGEMNQWLWLIEEICSEIWHQAAGRRRKKMPSCCLRNAEEKLSEAVSAQL
jgi:hypothetical protein